MGFHRNSQKRYYVEGASYFLTGVTKHRFFYFEEESFCEVFKDKLIFCKKLKSFQLHGWFLGFDHFHLLITPGGKDNISEIMRCLKTNISRDINRIMTPEFKGFLEGEVCRPRLQENRNKTLSSILRLHNQKIKSFNNQFHQLHPNPNLIPKFQWQSSFHDHLIRNEKDFEAHMNYIEYNLIKHKMPGGWSWWGVDYD